MKKFLIIMTLTLASCATRVTSKKSVQNAEVKEQRETSTTGKLSIDWQQLEQAYSSGLKSFNYDFTLKSVDAAQPAHMVEYRQGKPFRTLEVKNATYTEGKALHDSVVSQRMAKIVAEFTKLKATITRQRMEITSLKKKSEQLKLEGGKIANNFKFLLWFLLLAALIWIGQSTGLFFLFKKLLKAV